MKSAARINLQRGIQQNKSQNWTNYNIDVPLDAYIIHRKKLNDEEQQKKAFDDYIKAVDEKIEEMLDESIEKIFKK